jgi:uncharacterized protein YjiS (DUF1127 family)
MIPARPAEPDDSTTVEINFSFSIALASAADPQASRQERKMFGTFRQRIRNWYLVRRATTQLSHLDDHLLADLGIERQEIRRRAREAASVAEQSR